MNTCITFSRGPHFKILQKPLNLLAPYISHTSVGSTFFWMFGVNDKILTSDYLTYPCTQISFIKTVIKINKRSKTLPLACGAKTGTVLFTVSYCRFCIVLTELPLVFSEEVRFEQTNKQPRPGPKAQPQPRQTVQPLLTTCSKMESGKFGKTTPVEAFGRMPDCLIKFCSFVFPFACTCECLAFSKSVASWVG